VERETEREACLVYRLTNNLRQRACSTLSLSLPTRGRTLVGTALPSIGYLSQWLTPKHPVYKSSGASLPDETFLLDSDRDRAVAQEQFVGRSILLDASFAQHNDAIGTAKSI